MGRFDTISQKISNISQPSRLDRLRDKISQIEPSTPAPTPKTTQTPTVSKLQKPISFLPPASNGGYDFAAASAKKIFTDAMKASAQRRLSEAEAGLRQIQQEGENAGNIAYQKAVQDYVQKNGGYGSYYDVYDKIGREAALKAEEEQLAREQEAQKKIDVATAELAYYELPAMRREQQKERDEQQRLLSYDVETATAQLAAIKAQRENVQKELSVAQRTASNYNRVPGAATQREEAKELLLQLQAREKELSVQIETIERDIAAASKLKAQTETQNRVENLNIEAANAQMKALETQLANLSAEYSQYTPDFYDPVTSDLTPSQADERSKYLTKRMGEVREQMRQLQSDIFAAEKWQKEQGYLSIMDDENFAQYAQQGAAMPGNDVMLYQNGRNLTIEGLENPEFRMDWDKLDYALLTDDERSIHNAILGRDGEKAALEYLDYMQETLNARKGQNLAESIRDREDWLGRTMGTGVYAAVQGIDVPIQKIKQAFSDERIPTSALQYGKQYIYEDLGPLGRIAYDLVSGVSGQIPAILANTLVPGSGAVVRAVSGYGQGYNYALSKGYSEAQAKTYGSLIGASQALLQKYLGGIGALGGTSEKIAKAVSRIDSVLLRLSAQAALQGLSEFGEEYLEEFLDPVYRNLLLGEENNIEFLSDEQLYSGFLGFLTSLVLNAPANIANFATARADSRAATEADNQQKIDAWMAEVMQNSPQSQQTDPYETVNPIMQDVMAQNKTSRNFVRLVEKISSDLGVPIVFKNGQQIKADFIKRQTEAITNLESIANPTQEQMAELASLKDTMAKVQGGQIIVNGDVTANGIVLNTDTDKPLNRVVGHEVTHKLSTAKHYTQLRDAVFAYARAKGVDIDGKLADRGKLYEGIADANPEAELVADLVGDYLFTDYDFVSNLSVEHQNVFQRLWNEIKYLCKIATVGSREARDLARLEKVFADAYRATENTATERGVKYSIVALENGNTYVKASRNVIQGKTKAEQRKEISNFFDRLLEGNASLDIHTIEGDVLTITKENTAHKARDDYKIVGDQKVMMSDEEFAVKLRIESHIDEIAEASKKRGKDSDKKNHSFAKDGFTYRRAYFEDFDGQYYEVTLSIGHNGTIATVYNVGKIKGSVPPSAKIIAAVGSKPLGGTLSKNSKSQKNNSVKTENSISQKGEQYTPIGDFDVFGKDVEPSPIDAVMADVMQQAQQQKNQTASQQDMVDAIMADAMGAKTSDSGETATARVLTEEPPTGKKKISAWNLFKDNVVDKGTVFETLSLKTGNRELQAKWKAIGRAESSAQWFMEHGSAETNSLKSIRETVEKSGKTQAFYDYLYHLHNVDRMNLEARYDGAKNKPVFGDSVTSELSAEEAAKLEKENPEFKQWADEVYSYISALRNMMVEGGVISQKTADLWAEMYPHYVPIRREGKDGLGVDVPLDTKRTGVNAPIKSATGGSSNILPLFNTMAARTEQTFKAIAKNRFGVELKNLLGTAIEKASVGVDEAIDSAESETLKEGKDGKNPTFTVFENGQKVTFEITDEMYDTMKPKSKFNSYTSKVLSKANDIRRGLLTEYNPAFMITNPIKDLQDVLINSQHPAKTYAAIPKAVAEMVGKKGKKGPYYREYMEHGGEQNSYFDGETKTFSKGKSRLSKVIGFPLEKISQVNNFIERIPRMAEYIASREMGRSVDVSMLDAARVTTDFSAGGDFVKTLNRNGFTFLNASVQGAVQQVRNFREAKAEGIKGWAKLAAKFAVAGLVPNLLNDLLWDDDEDYEDLPDYVKQNYYIVAKYGDGKFVRIPKGRALAVIQDGFRHMENLITGNDEADFNAFAELVVSNLAPNNPLENHLIAPVSQAMRNKAWHGGDIVPAKLKDLPAAEQYDESTDALSKWLGEKLDVSPYKVNYVLDQYSGAVGDVVLPMLTPEAERGNNSWWGNAVAPITDKFTTDSVMNNQNVSDFYTKKEELTKKANSSKATKEDDVRSKYMDNVNKEISKLYKKQREIQNGDLPDDEKYEAVRDIQKQIVELTKEALNAYGSIRMEKDYRPDGTTKDLIIKAMDSVGGYGDKTTEQNYRNLIYSPATAVIGGDVQDKVFEYAVRYNDAVAKEKMGDPITTEWMVEAKNIKGVQDRVDYFIGYVTGQMAQKAGDGKYDGLSNLLDEGTIDDRAALLACSDTVEDAYLAHCKSAGVPVGTWLEVYGYANSQDGSTKDQREKGLKYIELLSVHPRQKVALAKALFAAEKGFIPYEAKIPKDWLARVGG